MTKNVNYEQEVVLFIASKNSLRVVKPNLHKLRAFACGRLIGQPHLQPPLTPPY